MLPSDMRRLRELEDENSRLKRIVADLTLDREMLQDVIKRKLLGWIGSASLSTVFGKTGGCLSGAPARCCGSTDRPTSMFPAAPIRPS